MERYKTEIPLHKLTDYAEYNVSVCLYGKDNNPEEWVNIENYPVHRDNHFFFLIIESGEGALDIDFQRINLRSRELYVVTPGQLHGNINARGCKGWVVLMSPDYISSEYREVLYRNMFRVKPHRLSDKEFNDFKNVLQLLVSHLGSGFSEPMFEEILRSISGLFLSLSVKAFILSDGEGRKSGMHTQQMAYRFKEMVRNNYKTDKSVRFYAEKLYITSGYLNDILKEVTGFPPTYWIIEEIILEAKRLLTVTNLTVKEIAYRLGYENYSYFTRLFHKRTGMTPLLFRESSRK